MLGNHMFQRKEGKRSSNYRHDGNKKEYNGNKSDLDYWFILD